MRVRDLGNRWGSCSSEGVRNFHWRTIRLPPTLIEYVAAHELVHLLEPRHDAAFWERLIAGAARLEGAQEAAG